MMANSEGIHCSMWLSGQYRVGSRPSPRAIHSADQYGDAGSRSSRAPTTAYFAEFSCRYDLSSQNHAVHSTMSPTNKNASIHLDSRRWLDHSRPIAVTAVVLRVRKKVF